MPGSWPPRSCPRHSHPALGASRSSQQIWFARRLLPRRFSPTPPPTRPHSLPPSDTAEQVLELAPPPYLGDAHLPAALSDHGEGADVQQSDPHPRCPAVLRTGDPGSRGVCARLDTYGSSGRSRQRLTPRRPPRSSGRPGDSTPAPVSRDPKEGPWLDLAAIGSAAVPPSHPCTRISHTHLAHAPVHVPHTPVHTPLHAPAHTRPPVPPLHKEKCGNGSQAAPTGSCCRMRSQEEDAEEGCGSRRFAAGAGRGRDRAETEAAVAWETRAEGGEHLRLLPGLHSYCAPPPIGAVRGRGGID